MGDDYLDKIIGDKRIVTVMLDTNAHDELGNLIVEIIEGNVVSCSAIGLGFVDITGVGLWLPLHTIVRIVEKDNNSEQPIAA